SPDQVWRIVRGKWSAHIDPSSTRDGHASDSANGTTVDPANANQDDDLIICLPLPNREKSGSASPIAPSR
ncbi:MAG: hypothetical protein KDA61_10095, partial [Planctomycetales bacterium]|nr:hypothetical protein [Planctomycetales bacterium]